MADSASNYQVGPGRPPLHTRFKKGQSGNPGGRSTKSLPALLADALNETVVVTIDGRRRTVTKREAIVTQMVDQSAAADLRATKMLIDMLKEVEEKAGAAAPGSAELTGPAGLTAPAKLAAEDREVIDLFVARLRRQIAAEAAEAEFVVPAKAGTQEPATEVPGFEPGASSGFPLSRERRG